MEGEIVQFKAVLLGNSSVGKTSLMQRWTTGLFNPNTHPTVGSNHQKQRVDLDGQAVDVYIWDTAGQERFQALTPLYARGASVAIIVVSIADGDSLMNVDQWIELLHSASDDEPPMVLAINKIDLENDSPAFTRDEVAEHYASRFAGVFYVSAATGEGVSDLFLFSTAEGYKYLTSEARRPSPAIPTEKVNNGCSC